MKPEGPVDCLIVGGGPAGLTAALYLRRFRRKVALLDEGHSRALQIECTRNFPAFPEGISGAALLQRLRQQVANVDGEVISARVQSLQREEGGFLAITTREPVFARTVLVATGVVDCPLPVAGAEALRNRGLLRQCPICDGYEHTDRRIAVVGSGAHAGREAMFLRLYSRAVTVLRTDGQEPVPASLLPDLQASNIVVHNEPLLRIDASQAAVQLHLARGGPVECDVVYAAAGVQPRTELLAGFPVSLDSLGALIADRHGRLDIAGLYACGDVVSALDQISVAVGQAAVAATAIHNDLRNGLR